jgi:hypothetical protein
MTSDELRQLVANTVSQESGATDASKYWRVVLPDTWKGPYPRHWCGGFALWALKTVLRVPWYWSLDRRQPGFLNRLPKVNVPDLGDIAYRNEPYAHHGVVTAVGDDFVITMDGNQGPAPGEVRESYLPFSKWTCFYSIRELIAKELDQ